MTDPPKQVSRPTVHLLCKTGVPANQVVSCLSYYFIQWMICIAMVVSTENKVKFVCVCVLRNHESEQTLSLEPLCFINSDCYVFRPLLLWLQHWYLSLSCLMKASRKFKSKPLNIKWEYTNYCVKKKRRVARLIIITCSVSLSSFLKWLAHTCMCAHMWACMWVCMCG